MRWHPSVAGSAGPGKGPGAHAHAFATVKRPGGVSVRGDKVFGADELQPAKHQRIGSAKAAVEGGNRYEAVAGKNIEDAEEPQLTVQLMIGKASRQLQRSGQP